MMRKATGTQRMWAVALGLKICISVSRKVGSGHEVVAFYTRDGLIFDQAIAIFQARLLAAEKKGGHCGTVAAAIFDMISARNVWFKLDRHLESVKKGKTGVLGLMRAHACHCLDGRQSMRVIGEHVG